MEFDFSKREARLSVGELASFALRPQFGEGGPGGAWRTEVGRQWHQSLQAASLAAAGGSDSTVAVEVPLEARYPLGGWIVRLGGRIDEVTSAPDGHRFREIKTVQRPLPADPDELRASYPEYFAQLAIYVELARLLPTWNDRPIDGELLFVEIDEGFVQTVTLDEAEPAYRFRRQLDQLERFLKLRGTSYDACRELPRQRPFEAWRAGQEEALNELERVRHQVPIVLFEAPTGFGKTGLALHHALEELRDGRMQRIVFLTGKSSGQAPIVRQLEAVVNGDSGLRYLQMRNRQDLRLTSGDALTFDRRLMAERWRAAGLRLEDLFTGPTATPEQLRALGERHELDPHALARALLALADIWIGDYNYLFSPGSAGVFNDVPGFSPAQTVLIVDEAHNLPARAAGAWSHRFEAAEWHVVASELARLDWPTASVRAAEELAGFLDSLRATERLHDSAHFEGQGLLRRLSDVVQTTPLPWEEAEDFIVECLWRAPAAMRALENELVPMLSWAPRAGAWALTCLDAAAVTGPLLQRFGAVLLMSATLSPIDETCARLGVPTPTSRHGSTRVSHVEGEAAWRHGAYRVAIDTRVDTRFQKRGSFLRRTALTVQALTDGQPAPIAVFFSSYRYAEEVARALEWEAPHLRIATQPRGLDLAGQAAFLEESLLTAHALFLILGSSFSEGIDQLGGRIQRAMVVGPALPEVDAVQEATRQALQRAGHPDPFRATYQIPGLTRIQQALGRLVRAPGHSAEVLLHGKRFADPLYAELFHPDFRDATVLRNDHDLALWLGRHSA